VPGDGCATLSPSLCALPQGPPAAVPLNAAAVYALPEVATDSAASGQLEGCNSEDAATTAATTATPVAVVQQLQEHTVHVTNPQHEHAHSVAALSSPAYGLQPSTQAW
jgi:hypothetical protein